MKFANSIRIYVTMVSFVGGECLFIHAEKVYCCLYELEIQGEDFIVEPACGKGRHNHYYFDKFCLCACVRIFRGQTSYISGCALQVKLGDNFALGLNTSPWVSQKVMFKLPCIFWVERLKMTGDRGK